MDDTPEKARFLTGAAFSELVNKYHDKAKDLKSLYGFKLLLKKRAAESQTIGEGVGHEKLKDIIWNVVDPG